MRPEVSIDRLEAAAFTVPTDRAESDGTLAWSETTVVVVEASGGGERGLGWTYLCAVRRLRHLQWFHDHVRRRPARAAA